MQLYPSDNSLPECVDLLLFTQMRIQGGVADSSFSFVASIAFRNFQSGMNSIIASVIHKD